MSPAPPVIPPFPYADLLSKGPFNDWCDDLVLQGYAVVPAIPREKALALRDRALGWLESFPYGFKRSDPATFQQESLPLHFRGGMYGGYGFNHEQFVWDIRTDPGVVGAFEKLWGTNELVTSFDGGAIMLPGTKIGEEDPNWHHIDQNPSRVGFFVAQGLVNLNENGDNDGGLLVMKGSSALMSQFFDEHGRPPIPEGSRIDWHAFSADAKKWFVDRGCEWIKVNAQPGDLILWDSSTMHQNCPPTGTRSRIVTYVCMGPASLLTEEDKVVRKAAFKAGQGTTHAPFHGAYSFGSIAAARLRPETGKPDPLFSARKNPVEHMDAVLKLAGMLPY